MKPLLTLFCSILITGAASAQDMILSTDEGEIKAVVLGVSRKEVTYKKWDDATTVHTKPASEVQSIRYQSGETETFTPDHSAERTNSRGYKPDRTGMKYQGDFALAYAGITTRAPNPDMKTNIQIESVHGIRINPYIFTGIGIGYASFSSGEEYEGIFTYFANVRFYYFLSRRVSIFLSSDIGGAKNTKTIYPDSRFFFSCGPGINIGEVVRCSFSIRYQHLAKGLNAIQLRLGIGF